MGVLTTLRSKYELYRLEQRYTRRNKRTTFASGAVYVDGEYIYTNGPPPPSPGEGGPNEDSPSFQSSSPTASPSMDRDSASQNSSTATDRDTTAGSARHRGPNPGLGFRFPSRGDRSAASSAPGSPIGANGDGNESGKGNWGRMPDDSWR